MTGGIDRPRLVGLLETIPGGGVGLLVAPAGAGKSVLMAEWARGHDPCWLSLSDAHNDAFVTAQDLASAVHEVHDTFDPTIARLAASGGSRLGATFVDALAAELAEVPAPVLLVLDDLHQVTDGEVLDDLGRLLLGLPGNVRAVASSRWDLPLGLGRMRLQGDLVELRSTDLAFEPDEAAAMLERASGRAITPTQAKALVDRTEGWAAGLQLAALSLANADDVDVFIDRFAGDDRLVADYLTGEVLRDLDDRTRSFLLRTSVLAWLTPQLCAAVTDEADAPFILHTLSDRGYFLTRTGPAERFRYHQLFADLLRFQLAVEDPTAEAQCRRRAATWLLDHHELASGVEQLLAAGEHREAFEVLDTHGHRLFEHGEVATLVHALTRIRDADDSLEPRLGILLLAAQVGADEFTAATENYRSLSHRRDLSPGERVAIDTLASNLGFGYLPAEEMRRLADGVLRSLPDVEPSSVPDFAGAGGADSCETMAAVCSSLAAFFLGDLESSASGLERALELPGAKYPLWRINALGMLALTRAWAGRLTDAEGLALTALDAARDVDAMDHIAVTCSHLALAVIKLDRLDVAAAGLHLDAAASCVSRCRRPPYEQLLHVLKVRHLSMTHGAQAALAHLRDVATPGVDRPVTAQCLKTLEARLLIQSGSAQQARALLESVGEPVPAAWIDVLVTRGDITGARDVLDTWDPPVTDLRASLERDLRRAVVTQQEGRPGLAGTQVADAAVRAETEGLLAPFLDAPLALRLLRTSAPARPLNRARALLDDTVRAERQGHGNDQLIEPLTPREVTVLDYLPSRLGNEQIAAALYVSVNTLKTHLRNIYRKLDAPDRDTAVEHATRIGLI